MLEVIRRLILGLALFGAILYTWWTVPHVTSVRVLERPPAGVEKIIPLQGESWDQLEAALRNDATHITRDPALRDRLADRDRSLIDSTLRLPAAQFRYFYRPGELPLDQLPADFAGSSPSTVYAGIEGDPARLLAITRHDRPASSQAPLDIVYPNFRGWRGSVSMWLLLAGWLCYLILGQIAKANRGLHVPLDGLGLTRQTLLGLLLVSGMTWVLVVRNDPVSAMFNANDWQSLVTWLGMLIGAIVLVSAGRRAAHVLLLETNPPAIRRLVQSQPLNPGDAVEFTQGPNKREYRIRTTDGLLRKVYLSAKVANAMKDVLNARPVTAVPARRDADAAGLIPWLARRVLPALCIVAGVGLLAGWFRGNAGFLVGLQGLILGCALGAIIGYFTRHDEPDTAKPSWCLLAAATAVAIFTLAAGTGMGLALRSGDILAWLGEVLDGSTHEQFWGFSRYRWNLMNLRPGPLAWVLLNAMDMLFLFAMTFLLLRVTLPTNMPDGENARRGRTTDE